MSLHSVSTTLLMQVPRKQQISLNDNSGLQMGTSVPHSRESPTSATHHILLVLLSGSGSAAKYAILMALPAPHLLRGHCTYSVTANLQVRQEPSSWCGTSPASNFSHDEFLLSSFMGTGSSCPFTTVEDLGF